MVLVLGLGYNVGLSEPWRRSHSTRPTTCTCRRWCTHWRRTRFARSAAAGATLSSWRNGGLILHLQVCGAAGLGWDAQRAGWGKVYFFDTPSLLFVDYRFHIFSISWTWLGCTAGEWGNCFRRAPWTSWITQFFHRLDVVGMHGGRMGQFFEARSLLFVDFSTRIVS